LAAQVEFLDLLVLEILPHFARLGDPVVVGVIILL
jgi:hypothetical protein